MSDKLCLGNGQDKKRNTNELIPKQSAQLQRTRNGGIKKA